MNVAYLIVGGFVVTLGIIIYKTFRDNKELKHEVEELETTIKIEEHAIHSLEDVMKDEGKIKRINNVKKEELKKAAGNGNLSGWLNKLSD